jgi:hypothetical protein
VPNGACLPGGTTTTDTHSHVKLALQVSDLEGLSNNHARSFATKELIQGAGVYGDGSVSRP